MKKKNSTGMGVTIPRKIHLAGMTYYLRQGQVVGRMSSTHEKRSNTLPQFVQRQKLRHTIALWKMLSFCDTMFTERRNACLNFKSLANRLPVVYVTQLMSQASFLMPGIPVSDGRLPVVNQQLGEVDGVAALITDLDTSVWDSNKPLWLYTAVQHVEHDLPRVRFSMREISQFDMTAVDGHLALVDEEFADDMKGWALVLVNGDRCSPQGIVTRCTLYQRYTTEEALQVAAESYGGLTDRGFLFGG